MISAGDESSQLCSEITSSSQETREELFELLQTTVGCFQTSISTEETLAMKAELQIPWKKLRVMRRY